VRIVDGSNEVLQVRLSDAAERPVTATPQREESWPYWSDVAQRLVFQVAEGTSRSDLVLWSAREGETPITRTALREERWPTWSPRAPLLAYAFRRGEPPGGLALWDLEHGESRLAAQTGPQDYLFRPSFSPDGRRLVAQRRAPDGRGSNLWLVEPGAPPRALTADPEWYDMKPYFSRDGDRVFFSRGPAAGGPRDVVSISTRGGPVLTHASLPASDEHSGRPSPTRDEIAFVSDREGAPAVFAATLPDGPARRLSPAARVAFAPRWSPDGEKIAVITRPAGADEPHLSERSSLADIRVVVLDRAGGILLDVPGFMPSWMAPWPDGS
jgi:Tol biopolymer transport system component